MLGVLAVGVASQACAGPPPPPVHAPAPARETLSGNPFDGGAVPDDSIARVMRHELAADPVLAGQVVGVDVAQGVVDLQGTVETALAKERVLEIARVVRGVRAVVDRVQVAARPRPDYELDFAVANALSQDPAVAGAPIAARAHLGIVYLTGHVATQAERRAAGADVLGVPGVRDLVDDVVLRAQVPLDAHRTEMAAARVLRDDLWLDSSHLRIQWTGGTLRLSGWVGSPQEWARAEADARSASPTGSVDASAVRIDRWTDDGTLRRGPMVARSDGDLGQALLDAYVRDPRVPPFVPTVDVHDGIVILTGVAPNPDAARAVDADARDLPGAAAVHDFVKSAPTVEDESDASIAERVASSLRSDPLLAGRPIAVAVVQGRVFLRGTIPSERDRALAIGIAASAPGAHGVEDGLVLEPPRPGVANRQPQ